MNGSTPIKFHKLNPYTIENMKLFLTSNDYPVRLLESNDKNIEVRTDYLRFVCCDCGSEYMATWGQVVETDRFRCEKCVKKQSNLSYYVEQYLIEKDVEYIREFRFDDCRYKRALPFDFYLPLYNYVMLEQNKEELSKNRLGKLAMANEDEDGKVHMGIMAQDLRQYSCGRRILVEDEYEKTDSVTDTILHINPLDMTMAVMGALKAEIEKREALEKRLALIEDKLSKLEILLDA